jgi:hypothetical protein
MNQENDNTTTPASPEVEPKKVRDELDQDNVTHKGVPSEPSESNEDSSTHMGAMDDNVTPIRAPMRGPSDVVGDESKKDDKTVDPADEITPG